MFLLSRLWWTLVLRGSIAILFGVAAFSWPHLTLQILIQLFGVFALLDGMFTITFALTTSGFRAFRWPILVEGFLGMSFGFLACMRPFVAGVILLYLIAIWALATGALAIAAAIALRRLIVGEWLLGLAGCLSILLGVLLIANPNDFALWTIWLVGAHALIAGIVLILFGIRIHRFHQKQPKALNSEA